jgi:hypothetical protein
MIDPARFEEGRTAESAERRVELLFRLIEANSRLMRLLMSGSAGPALRAKVEAFCKAYIEAQRVDRLMRAEERFTIPRKAT